MTSDPIQSQLPRSESEPKDAFSSGKLFISPPVAEHAPLVLVATRQLQVRAVGTTTLQSAGFRIKTETQGETILGELASWQPDLILVDLELEDMDAGVFCQRLRELRAGQSVPVVVISDLVDTEVLQQVLAAELTDVVTTPVNWKVLTFRIHRWISLTHKLNSLSDRELDLEQVRDSALKASTELLQLRNYDSVTGLPNREMFLSTTGLLLSQNLRSSGYLAVLYLDIDEFKAVNDLIGRSLGDELLRIVAKRLQGCLRQGDLVSQAASDGGMASFARLNGDQFAVLLSSAKNQDGAVAVAKRILDSIARPLTIRDRQFRLAARIGIADSTGLEDASEETLVQRAETAMRYCKSRVGKTYALYESFMNELVRKKLEIKEELRQALDQNQLYLCYQFLVDSHSAVPRGVEGLIRWDHPTRGFVSPGEFMPVAEESDLILEIDRWVLRTGCRQGKRWLDSGYPPLLISLNVSMRFLEEEDFADQVLSIVDDTGLPPSNLQLELSERGTLPDAERIMPQFDKLVGRGVHLALDDFGTGQTSLSYLRTLPISCVKVDRAFVRRLPDDSASKAIVTAIVAMSHHLGLKVVAEGVETDEQWRFLAEASYNELQGFLFSRPERVGVLEGQVRELGEWGQPTDGPPALEEGAKARALEAPTDVSRVAEASASADGGPPAAVDTKATTAPAPAATLERLGDPPPRNSGSGQDSPERQGPPEDQLLKLARQDFLTKLFNRFSFDERLEHAVAHADRYGHKVALLLIDLDDFKYVNDTHGHAVGDGLLVALAERLQRLVRKVDTLARIGGDEMAVILSELHSIESVAELARRLLAVLAEPLEVEGRELRVTGSIGVSVYPAGNTQAKDLLRQADLALYRAKGQGGNSVRFFAHEMDRELQRSLALAKDLEGAIERGELFLEYQLQISLATGGIAGVEALVRWEHPKLGLITPDRFIPIAESTGEIRSIGPWVIRTACAEAKKWQERTGQEIRVSVNISVVQCRDTSFVESTVAALKEHGLAPRMLDLEVNEKLLNNLPQDLENALRRLRELGVGLTLDDFGSGTSALEHFQRFHFDRVKVHQSLVRTIGYGPRPAPVLSGILALANTMNVDIIAEGIERPEEAATLAVEGCTIGQGYLFSKPLATDPLIELIGRWDSSPPTSVVAIRAAAEQSAVEAPLEALAVPSLPDIDLQLSDDPAVVKAVTALDPSASGTFETSAEEKSLSPAEAAKSELRKRYTHAASVRRGVAWRRLGVVAVVGVIAALGVVFLPWLLDELDVEAAGPGIPSQTQRASVAEPVASEASRPVAPEPAATRSVESQPAATQTASPTPPVSVPAKEAISNPSTQALAVEAPAEEMIPVKTTTTAKVGPPIESLVQTTRDWARAWSEQRYSAYLEMYASDFRPANGLSREKWATQRMERILKPKRIEVELGEIDARQLDDRRVAVTFQQTYRSDNYEDTVRKTLELVPEEGAWKILAEYSKP